MSVYAVAQLTIFDRARYLAYVGRFPAVLARFGGKLLAADETPAVLEGTWDRQKFVLIEFSSEEGLAAWSSSEAHREIAVDRRYGHLRARDEYDVGLRLIVGSTQGERE